MDERLPRTLDMTPDGEFVAQAAAPPWALKLGLAATFVALVAGGLVVAALLLWFLSIMIPVALVAGLVAYAGFRFQIWRTRRSGHL
jgi:ABC-type uncharacterized transport system permease subunit